MEIHLQYINSSLDQNNLENHTVITTTTCLQYCNRNSFTKGVIGVEDQSELRNTLRKRMSHERALLVQ